MRTFKVTGMSCSACVARVEKAVNSLDGIESCSVNLLNKSMTVEGNTQTQDIINAVKKVGYGIKVDNSSNENEDDHETLFLVKIKVNNSPKNATGPASAFPPGAPPCPLKPSLPVRKRRILS